MIRRKKQRTNNKGSERGAILAVAAIGMVSFIFSAGLAIDISHFYAVGAELQNAADASALAGATALNHSGAGIHVAVDRAVEAMNKYEINGVDVTIGRLDVKFGVNLSDFDNGSGLGEAAAAAGSVPRNIRFVKVGIPPKSVGVSFSASILGNVFEMSRGAVAGQSAGLNKFNNFSKLILVQDGDSQRIEEGTNQTLNVISGGCPNDDVYTPGCTYDVRLSPPCSTEAGTYQIINQWSEYFADSELKKKLLCATVHTEGVEICPGGGETFTTQHINAQLVRQALSTMFDVYGASGMLATDFPADLNIAQNITYETYRNGAGAVAPTTTGMLDRRVMVLPIVNVGLTANGGDVVNEAAEDYKVRINKFGVFFLVKRPAGSGASIADLRLEYISESVVVGGGSYDPGICPNNANQQVTAPVLYR